MAAPTPPLPFRFFADACTAMGLDKSHTQLTVAETDDERLMQFMLYAQARSKGKPWSICPTYDLVNRATTGRFHIIHLRVEYDYYRENDITDTLSMMRVEYVVSEDLCCYWLDLPNVSAFCLTMADALSAIDAATPYIPATVKHRAEVMQHFAIRAHVQRCLRLMRSNGGGDDDGNITHDTVHAAALGRKLWMNRG